MSRRFPRLPPVPAPVDWKTQLAEDIVRLDTLFRTLNRELERSLDGSVIVSGELVTELEKIYQTFRAWVTGEKIH